MMMKTFTGILSAIALAASALSSQAMAQTASKEASLTRVKPVLASATACSTGLIEIAPVSFDTNGRAEAWVVVYRINGEIVASERVSPAEIEQLQRLPCRADNYRGAQLDG
ncbi:MAG: hypothetical protein B7Y90_00130 [Alphaproteobacteria bacterium 32-64-14]|nr:MAG: hypothetical protein B7Y90_00130 [Alphaproteobacteria bacterium 32-64-14]